MTWVCVGLVFAVVLRILSGQDLHNIQAALSDSNSEVQHFIHSKVLSGTANKPPKVAPKNHKIRFFHYPALFSREKIWVRPSTRRDH